jgi:mono/diheme cytochrome c family protein
MSRCVWTVICFGAFLSASLWAAETPSASDPAKLPPAATGTVDFLRDIQPILAARCVSCHGAARQRGGLRLDSAADTLKGGDTGVILKPGDAKTSRLLFLIAGLDKEIKQMPPAPKKVLSAEEIGKLRAWIEQGARWPKDVVITSTENTKPTHWAYQPIQRPTPPTVATAWKRSNPIDAFVQARLEKEKLTPSPEADRVTLIRRLSLDLLGLPPTPQEVDAFLADTRPDAYQHLVDRILASPHYGERWGRHWLDLAHYADSDGYEKDTGRPYAFRYRNWVIDALNRDLPFDEFTLEQLAGDLLPNATVEQKVATGFHRNTLTNREGGVDQEQFRVEACVDRVNTTGKVWLGTTIGCCQCHDHKYDPLSQREYYQFFAFFDSDREVDIPAPLPGEEEKLRPQKEAFAKKSAELQAAVATYQRDVLPDQAWKWELSLKPADVTALPAPILALVRIEPALRTAQEWQELAAHHGKSDKKLAELNKAVSDHARSEPKVTHAQTLTLSAARKTHVMIRGDFLRKGVEVEADTPSVLPPLPAGYKHTRLDLARWLVDPANPLTARVTVNWVWHKYFGRGLVATLEDFGTQGEKPSHPQLLDWLASEFVRQKWSLKALHKLIVTSTTYRQTSALRPELASRDPLNILLARQARHRLEAEIVRDNALAASGLLNPAIGGPSVRPPQPAGISELTYAGSARWVESVGPDRYRRGMYTWFQRTSPYPMLMTFDAPDSNVCCVRRDRSNTPLQALTLLNDTVFVECAQALGKRVVDDKPSDVKERVRYAFRLCVAREPSVAELERLVRLYDELLAKCRAKPDAAAKLIGKMKPAGADVPEAATWVALARTLLNLDEFVTRE